MHRMQALIERMANLDPSSPEAWREALINYGNALVEMSELRSRARFAQLAASGDLNGIRSGIADLTNDLEELLSVGAQVLDIGKRIDAQYCEWQQYLRLAVASRKLPEG
jgi:hypothetical protein